MKRRILIDANPVVPYFLPGRVLSGIGRTTFELIKALDMEAAKGELPVDIRLYSQNMKGLGARQMRTRFGCRHVWLRSTAWFNRLVAELRLREILAPYDLMHITHNFEYVAHPERCIVTLHDAFFMKINETRFNHLQMRREVPPMIRRCRRVITCSEYSKRDIVETMGVDPGKITVIPWGIDHTVFFREPDQHAVRRRVAELIGAEVDYFLSVSCNAERKRTDHLVRAFIDYCNSDGCPRRTHLVLVWANPPQHLCEEIAESGCGDLIHFVANVSNDDLRQLYNGAVAAFTPSSYEGFGLPLLEAMACGCPVVSAANSSLTEVGADVALYLEEPVRRSMTDIMARFDRGAYDRTELASRGMAHAADYTWQRAARATLDVYAEELSK